MGKKSKEKPDHAKEQAIAQVESIVEMVQAVKDAGDDDEKRDEAEDAIRQDALDVEVRSGWYNPCITAEEQPRKPEEFTILLCTGGPAVRIIGELDDNATPERARIQYQDWGTPWTEYFLTDEKEREAVLEYCRYFWFGQ